MKFKKSKEKSGFDHWEEIKKYPKRCTKDKLKTKKITKGECKIINLHHNNKLIVQRILRATSWSLEPISNKKKTRKRRKYTRKRKELNLNDAKKDDIKHNHATMATQQLQQTTTLLEPSESPTINSSIPSENPSTKKKKLYISDILDLLFV